MSNLESLKFFWPELILSATALIAILSDLFYERKDSHKVSFWAIGGLLLTFITIRLFGGSSVNGLFMGTMALDPFSEFFKDKFLVNVRDVNNQVNKIVSQKFILAKRN